MKLVKLIVVISMSSSVVLGVAYGVGLLQRLANSVFEGSPLNHPVWIPASILGLVVIFPTIGLMLDWYLKEGKVK